MSNILVIDHTPFWRETAADVLRGKGHTVTTASNGQDGLAALRATGADLIVLDVEMPPHNGFSILEEIRRESSWVEIPVIMLTGARRRQDILHAKELRAMAYLLKTEFDVRRLVDCVQNALASPSSQKTPSYRSAPVKSNAAAAPPLPALKESPAACHTQPDALTREQSLFRVERAMEGRSLPSVVAKVIEHAGSKHTSLSDLVELISRDPILAARILQRANSAALGAKSGRVTTLTEAVRIIGCTAICDIAASVMVFENAPLDDAGGFNLIRYWRHLLAVAALCRHLAPALQSDVAYLIGLCHSLGDMLFHTHFHAECSRVMAAVKATGLPPGDFEQKIFGITRHELVEKILLRMELPPAIRRPIIDYHRSTRPGYGVHEPLARLLMVADMYAKAVMQNFRGELLQPITKAEVAVFAEREDVEPPNAAQFRTGISARTAECASLTREQMMELTKPGQRRKPVRVWLARDSTFSSFGPVTAALEGMVEVTVRSMLPTPEEVAGHRALVVVARSPTVNGLTREDIASASSGRDGSKLPTLWLVGKKGKLSDPKSEWPDAKVWPIAGDVLADFVEKL